jgi:hypothetical protein
VTDGKGVLILLCAGVTTMFNFGGAEMAVVAIVGLPL